MRISDWSSDVCSSDLVFEGSQDINDVRTDLRAYNGVLVTVFMFAHVREYLLNLYPGQIEETTNHGADGVWTVNGRARKGDVSGKSVSLRVGIGGRRIINTKNKIKHNSIRRTQS